MKLNLLFSSILLLFVFLSAITSTAFAGIGDNCQTEKSNREERVQQTELHILKASARAAHIFKREEKAAIKQYYKCLKELKKEEWDKTIAECNGNTECNKSKSELRARENGCHSRA